ncbi:hypothetical protein GEMRC1_003132 [Eukaryota sp. GEM-RC1]
MTSPCFFCPITVDDINGLAQHLLTHVPLTAHHLVLDSFSCFFCAFSHHSVITFLHHLFECWSSSQQERTFVASDVFVFRCLFCASILPLQQAISHTCIVPHHSVESPQALTCTTSTKRLVSTCCCDVPPPPCKKSRSVKASKTCPYCTSSSDKFTHVQLTHHLIDEHLSALFSNFTDDVQDKLRNKTGRTRVKAQCHNCTKEVNNLFNITQHGLKCNSLPLELEFCE